MIMATSKDFQNFQKRYQVEGLPYGVSINRFCEQNGIAYKQYERWLKNRSTVAIHPVSLTNVPNEAEPAKEVPETSSDEIVAPVLSSVTEANSSPVLFNIRIVTSSGMLLQHRNLDFAKLLNLVQRLEGLC